MLAACVTSSTLGIWTPTSIARGTDGLVSMMRRWPAAWQAVALRRIPCESGCLFLELSFLTRKRHPRLNGCAAHSRFCHLAFSYTRLPSRQQPHGFRDVEYGGDRRFLCLAHA